MEAGKKILLIDADDSRRETRVGLLTDAGYTVDLRKDYISAERLDHEGDFDLVIIALHTNPEATAIYSDQLSKSRPRLPILLITDQGVFAPPGTLSPSMESGDPAKLMREIALMLEGSTHIRQIPRRL